MSDPILFLILITLSMTLFVWGRWRFDYVAFLTLMAAVMIGLIPPEKAFSGFSHPAVITVAAIMVLSYSISASGVIDNIIAHISPKTSNKNIQLTLLCLTVGLLSGFMNNTGALALLIPVAMRTSSDKRISPSILLMPLAFTASLGGMLTLIGTPPNLIISSVRETYLGHPYHLFDFTPVGSIVALMSVIFIVLLGWRLLPNRAKISKGGNDLFEIHNYVTEVRIPLGSLYAGKTKRALKELVSAEFTLLGIIRKHKKKLIIRDEQTILENDILIIEATHQELQTLQERGSLELVHHKVSRSDVQSGDVELAELVIGPDSKLIGRTFDQSRVRYRFNINLLALSHYGKTIAQRIKHTKLRMGDIILLMGHKENLGEATQSLNLLPLRERGVHIVSKYHTYVPILCFLCALIAIACCHVPVSIGFCLAILVLIATNTLPMRHIYGSLDWPVLMLLAAMIPVGQALETSGTTHIIADFLLRYGAGFSPIFLLFGIMTLTMVISAVLNNATTTVIMAPIAVTIAQALHVNIDPFLMAVCLGASCSFLTPIGHPNNVLVMGPGRYQFGDYFRLGIPLTIFVISISIPAILNFWPLH